MTRMNEPAASRALVMSSNRFMEQRDLTAENAEGAEKEVFGFFAFFAVENRGSLGASVRGQ